MKYPKQWISILSKIPYFKGDFARKALFFKHFSQVINFAGFLPFRQSF